MSRESRDLTSLNSQQLSAVKTLNGPIMVLAGAGTGKTRVITYRIAHILDSGGLPEKIVAVTFTNKAAKEMKERMSALVGANTVKLLRVGTFHRFCLDLLRKYHKSAGLSPGFTLIGTGDQIDLVRRAVLEKGWKGLYDHEKLHASISRAKNELLTPESIEKSVKSFWSPQEDPKVVAEVFRLYERQLQLHRAIDFDDCIYKAVRLLREDENVKTKVRQSISHIMVDEFQDTNRAQLALLEQIVDTHSNICVVGDDDQSIYSWRGAMYEVLETFEQLFPGTRLIKLEQNYRSTNVILNAANGVIRNNAQRKDKTLWSSNSTNTPITVHEADTEQEESFWIARQCMSYLGRDFRSKDIAILYRANSQAKQIEMALREHRLQYQVFGGQSFFERKEIKDFVCYLRLILNFDDHLALWRIINVPTRGIGLKTQEKIENLARDRNITPFAAIKEFGDSATGEMRRSLLDFHALIENLSSMPLLTPEDLEKLGLAIISQCQLERDLKESIENPATRQAKIENLKSLPKWLAELGNQLTSDDELITKQAITDRLSTSEAPANSNAKENSNSISLMTIHAAKGLEFPIVFVCGAEEDLLPHLNSQANPKSIDEERRLFYVAVTRAKEILSISYCETRQSGFKAIGRKRSRFIDELPEDSLTQAMTDEELEEQKKDQKKATLKALGSLRSLLLED